MKTFNLVATRTFIGVFLISTTLWVNNAVMAADDMKDISQMIDQGQTIAALDKLNALIAANPKNAPALFTKGVLLAEQGRRDEAIKVFVDLTTKFPNLPEPYNNLAVLYADQGQFDKARKALEAAIKTHPSYATAHENLGDIYARMASEAYDKALQIDTTNTSAQKKLSLIKDLFGGAGSNMMSDAKVDPVAANTKNMPPKTDVVDNTVKAVDKSTDNKQMGNNSQEDIIAAINTWAQAWSSKNIEQYLASYSETFKPSKGLSRAVWQQQRRERVSKPSKISVELNKVSVVMVDSNNARVRFKQIYRADGAPIRTAKLLFMKKQGSNWLIEQEIASN